jgi:hypothetical protein
MAFLRLRVNLTKEQRFTRSVAMSLNDVNVVLAHGASAAVFLRWVERMRS